MKRRSSPTHLRHKNIWLALAIALAYMLIVPAIGIPWRLNAFLGPLIIALYRCTPLQCLWLAAGCGTILDLFAAPYPMGMHATALVCTEALLLYLKDYFFADVMSTLPLLVGIGAFTSITCLAVGLSLFGHISLPLWWPLFIDGMLLAIGDALLAEILFMLPKRLF